MILESLMQSPAVTVIALVLAVGLMSAGVAGGFDA